MVDRWRVLQSQNIQNISLNEALTFVYNQAFNPPTFDDSIKI